MKISVITVTYNSENTLEKTILSVAGQTYKNIEHLIIDGASTDKTLEIVDKYRHNITKIISEPDKGIYDAMNKGIAQATGDYLIFLNSDDELYDSTVLEKFAAVCQKHGTDLVWGDLCYKNIETGATSVQKHDKFNKIYLIKNTPAQPSTFYRREIFEQVGLFSVDFRIVSDQEWFLRAFLKNKPSWTYLGYPVNTFSTGGVSTSAAHEGKHAAERREMFGMYFGGGEFKFYSFVAKYLRSVSLLPVVKLFFQV